MVVEQVSCIWEQEDLPSDEQTFVMAEVTFLDKKDIDELDGGDSTLFLPDGAVIDASTNQLIVSDPDTQAEVGHVPADDESGGTGRRRRLNSPTMGNKEVLVLRENRSVIPEAAFSDHIFGTGGDEVNLVSQYAACSYDQLTFSKYGGRPNSNGAVVNEGVLSVSIADDIAGSAEGTIRNSMLSKATSDLGGIPLNQLVDFVMVCIPPGTNDGWIIYSYINHWLSGT
jgi:hypothetical protein